MTDRRVAKAVHAAIAEELLPPDATLEADDHRPWPVVLLIGLGAWLATLPLLVAIGLMFGDAILRGPFAVLMGLLLIALAVVLFRAQRVPLFVEQLGLPALLVGGGCLGFGLFHHAPAQLACAGLGVIAVGVAWAAGRAWVRNLLGALAAVLIVLAMVSERALNLDRGSIPQFWIAWHVAFGIWVAGEWVQQQAAKSISIVPLAIAVESIGAGWLLAVLAGLAWLAGMTFLAGSVLEQNIAADIARELSARQRAGGGGRFVQPLVSTALAAAAIGWGASAWPSLRQTWCIGVAAILLVLSWFMPTLGAVLLALAVCATAQRWLLAGTAALAMAWIIGAFYYALDYPLAKKALVLLVAGAVLAAVAWLGMAGRVPATPRSDGDRGGGSSSARGRWRLAGIAATLVLTLAVANGAIWQKEDVIRNGRPVYVELVPVDPRSLMQGDYMALNFRVPRDGIFEPTLSWRRPVAIAKVDERGVANLMRLEGPGTAAGPGELRIELTPKGGRWTVVTDAWFFREGDGPRFRAAKYGEFRVTPDGRALLVGMADAELKPIR